MAYYDYDFHENTLSIFKGRKSKKPISIQEGQQGYDILEIDGKFAGLRLQNAYDQHEKMGKLGEDLFSQLLQNQGIPSMFIGQNPLGLELNKGASTNLKRPDFIVNPPGKGSILIDVKTRSDLGSQFYPCSLQELESLVELDHEVRIPVWLAFTSVSQLDNDSFDIEWHFATASMLLRFGKEYNALLRKERPTKKGDIVRLPKSIFTPIKNQLYFHNDQMYSEELVCSSVDLFKDELRRVKDALLPECREFTKKKEVDSLIKHLIGQGNLTTWLYQKEVKEIIYAALEL